MIFETSLHLENTGFFLVCFFGFCFLLECGYGAWVRVVQEGRATCRCWGEGAILCSVQGWLCCPCRALQVIKTTTLPFPSYSCKDKTWNRIKTVFPQPPYSLNVSEKGLDEAGLVGGGFPSCCIPREKLVQPEGPHGPEPRCFGLLAALLTDVPL